MRHILGENTDESDNSKFNFKMIDDGVSCTFNIKKNGEEYTIFAKNVENETTFSVLNKNGKSTKYSEGEFSSKYPISHDAYKKAYNKFMEENADEDGKDHVNGTTVKPFSEFLNAPVEEDDKAYIKKEIEIDKSKFIFTINNNENKNTCFCSFKWIDEQTSEVTDFKASIYLSEANSNIFRIEKYDEDGQIKEIGSEEENGSVITIDILKKYYQKIYEKFMKAVNYIEKLRNSNGL